MFLALTTMPRFQPWCWPPDYTYDRVMYIPGQRAHLLEYQEELIDSEGNPYWKTTDTTSADHRSSVKEFQEQMKDYYEQESLKRVKDALDHPEKYE